MQPELRAYLGSSIDDGLVRAVIEEMGTRSEHAGIGTEGVERRMKYLRVNPLDSTGFELTFTTPFVARESIRVDYRFRHIPYDLAEGGKVVNPPPLAGQPDRWIRILGLSGFLADDRSRVHITLDHFRHFALHFPSRWAGVSWKTRAAKSLLQEPPDMAWPVTILGADLAGKADVRAIEWAGASVERLPTGALWVQCGENPFEPNASVLKRVWKFLPSWDEIRTP